jgi:hemerythrin
MPAIAWDDSYLIGIPRCDEQHKHLVLLLNQAHDAFVNNSEAHDVPWLLNELIDYATYHFIAEEKWMSASRFPDFNMHKAEHDAFSKQVGIMYQKYSNNDPLVLSEIFSFLNDWLMTHILKVDAEFGKFLEQQNRILSRNDLC